MSGHSRASKKRSKLLSKKVNPQLASSMGMVDSDDGPQQQEQSSSSSRNASKRQQGAQKHTQQQHKVPRLDQEVEESLLFESQALSVPLPEGATLKDILDLEEVVHIDAKTRAHVLLNWMTAATAATAVSSDNSSFYREHWESRPLVSERHARGHFKGLAPRKKIDRIIEGLSNVLGVDLYLSGMDRPILEGQTSEFAKPQEVWRALGSGCTVRLLQPQKHIDALWHLCSALEHEFGCRVGCEVDLTPPISLGETMETAWETAAEDSFFLCTAGRERWALRSPLPGAELPMYLPTAREGGPTIKPTLECVLHAGDSLYLPRGWTYSCRAVAGGDKGDKGDKAAVHVRIFTNSSNSFADYLNLIVPTALNAAADETLSLRRGFPRQYTSFLGVAHSENDEEPTRRAFLASMKKALQLVLERSLDLCDAGAELLHKRFISERLPVLLSSREEALSAPSNTIFPFTRLRMVRPGVACCIVEEGQCVVYHCMDNSRELFGSPLRPLEFELDDGPTIEALLQAYPEAVTVSTLPHVSEEIEDKVEVALALFKEGFLIIDDEASKPRNAEDDGDDDDPF